MFNKLFQLLLVCVFAVAALFAQSAGGTLTGRVTNAAGLGVPNAVVSVTNATTNVTWRSLTGQDGAFSVVGLDPGTYRVDVEMKGFKRTSQANVQLNATGPTNVNVTLETGSVRETVAVQADAPSVRGESADISTGLETRTVRELPLIDRNYQELVGLQPGVTPPVTIYDPIRDPARNRFFSSNGQSPLINLSQMEGVYNQEPFRGTSVRVQPVETIQQTNILTTQYAPKSGYTGGAIVDNVTRAGSNGLHGSLFYFNSNDRLRSRGYLAPGDIAKPHFVYNQFGAAAGGALTPDKTFLFGSYEGTYQRGAETQINTVPTPAARGGNFGGIPGLVIYNPFTGNSGGANRTVFPSNIVPIAFQNPTARAIASLLPAPNQPALVNNYVSNVPFLQDGNKFDGRLDHRFSDSTSGFLRYGYSNLLRHDDSPLGSVIGQMLGSRLVAQNAVGGATHQFNSRLVTDLRFGYNRYKQDLTFRGDQSSLGAALGYPFLTTNLVGINIPGLPAIGAPPDVPMLGIDNTFNLVWNWGLHTSAHNLKWGVDIRRIRSDGFINPLYGVNGTAFFGPGVTMLAGGPALSANGLVNNSFASFLLGSPSQVGVSDFLMTPSIRQTQWAFWLGDTLNLLGRVTVDLGARYEVCSPLEPRNAGGAQFFNPANNTFNYAGVGDVSMRASDYDLNNIAPRIGVAVRITPKTVVRGGYDISYFQVPYMYTGFTAPMTGAASGVQGGYAIAPIQNQFGPTLFSTLPAPDTLQNGAGAGNLPATVINQTVDTPYVQTYSLQVQQEFVRGTMLSLGYVGSLGRKLPFSYELNAARPGTGLAGLPFAALGRTASTTAFENGVTNSYNALQASLSKRFSEGLSFMASYTWSKALGYTTGTGSLLNPFNRQANYGPLDYDRAHVLTISHVWELPFGRHGGNMASTLLGGWQLNGVFTWQSGTPLTITANPISCACPGNTVLASLNGAPFGEGITFLNRSAFSAPGFGQFGNLGRGGLRGPDTWNYNLSLFKAFRIRDRFNLELRGEAYNLTNTPQYANPNTDINSPAFGQITNMTTTNSFGRQLNVGARVVF